MTAIVEPFVEGPLAEEIDLPTDPWEVVRRLADRPRLLFLDSGQSRSGSKNFSYVTADPFSWIEARGRRVLVDGVERQGDPWQVLDDRLSGWQVPKAPGLPPFQGGAAGLFGYDLLHHLERLPRPAIDEFQIPDLAIGFYDWVIAFDHSSGQVWLISTGMPETDSIRRRRRAAARLMGIKALLRRPGVPAASSLPAHRPSVTPARSFPLQGIAGVQSNFSHEAYLAAVARAVEFIHAGDCFQVNLSQRLLGWATETPLELYRKLRERNAAPFGCFFDLGPFALASASPERFLHVANGMVQTFPIKGTRPRGANPALDRAAAAELLASAKDRAENVMIVDLLRNDLGRVCRYGSVRVESVCKLESFRYVHHLVSEVRGQLRPECGPIDLLRAAFPGGSVTGAPKVRAMEIIAELEPTARGPYCGCLGYLGFDGSMDTNILIRTFTIGGGWIQFPVGGGIVADSTPAEEFAETLHKAKGLLKALQ
jgi:para-aminobenzoate synthetase component 1